MPEFRHDGIACFLGAALFSVGRMENRLFIGDGREPFMVTVQREDSAVLEAGPFKMNIYYSIHDSIGIVSLLYGYQLVGQMREVSETGIKFLVAVLQRKGEPYRIYDTDSDSGYDSS